MRTFWKAGLRLLLILAIFLFVGGCRDSARGSISIVGSTSMQPYVEVLGEAFEDETGIKVDVNGGGSSVGIQAALQETADIGMSSRDLKPNEQKLVTTVVAKDGVAVIVNPKNSVSDLTISEIRNLFSGKFKNWKEVGGKNEKVTVVTREEGSGTREAFQKLVMGDEEVTDEAIVQGATGSVKQTVAGSPRVIGYMSLVQVDANVKAVRVDGIMPSEKSVLEGKYPIARSFLFVTHDEPTGNVKKFIDFVLSSEGQEILKKNGAIPIKQSRKGD